MTIQPSFDPQRSAEIRTLLIQTVDAHRPHPSRSKFAIVAALTGIALALAGGTAALALTGVLRFGSPEPAPLPPPAPTTSTSPTPTPSPTPQPTERPIAVQSSPITYHDVRTHPSTPSWSLDLPGADQYCAQHHVYDIADGLALFQVGANFSGDRECDLSTQEVSLSLVDTAAGRILWSRDWTWKGGSDSIVIVDVLGTSGRVVVVDQALAGGPSEVVDLATGTKLADFAAEKRDRVVEFVPVGGDSGDVLMTTPNGIVRVDPRDVAHPRWSTAIDASFLTLYEVLYAPVAEFVPIVPSGPPGATSSPGRAFIDVETGAVDHDVPAGEFLYTQTTPVLLSDYIDLSAPRKVTGLDASGKQAWTLDNPSGASVTEVQSLTAGMPGVASGHAGTGLLALTSVNTLSLIDAVTGRQLWTADAARCGYTSDPWAVSPRVTAYMNSTQDELMLETDGKTCTFSASTGAPHPLPDLQDPRPVAFGPGVTYLRPRADRGPVHAYDRETGEALWTAEVPDDAWVKFAGGYLLSWKGTHIESMG